MAFRNNNYPLTNIPFCPDPQNYVLVTTREGSYWRKKRAKNVPLNSGLSRNAEASKVVFPAASALLNKLIPCTRHMVMGRITLRLAQKLAPVFKETGALDFRNLPEFEFQPNYPFHHLVKCAPTIDEDETGVTVSIPVGPGRMVRLSKALTHYYFELILLSGNPTQPQSLRVEMETSAVFSYENKELKDVVLSMIKPARKLPWMLLLKVNTMQGNKVVEQGRYCRMKVVAVG